MINKIILSIIVLYISTTYVSHLYRYGSVFMNELGLICIGIVLGILSREVK